jgi:hypothetical protein
VIRARMSFVFGPGGILSEGPMSATREIAAPIAAGGEQITWSFAAAIAQALTLEVHSIRLYATYDLAGTEVAQRDEPSRYLLIKEVVRDDANWNAGNVVDTFLPRLQLSPIPYVNTPLFYPKGVVAEGRACGSGTGRRCNGATPTGATPGTRRTRSRSTT